MHKSESKRRPIDGPILLAGVLTIGWYAFMSLPVMHGTLLHKYTTEHATEYIIVAMLCWGLSDLAFRCVGFRRESLALRHDWLPAREGQEPAAMASDFYSRVQAQPAWLKRSRLGARLRQALIYVHEKQSADGFDEHLRSIAERDSEQTHSNYAVPRFVVWVAPVLGFLGTVVHFGTALGGFSSTDLAEKLPIVTAGMGTAFNTTTMALGTSTLVMLCMFLVERAEQGIVRDVDQWAESELSNRFVVENSNMTPVMKAIEMSSRAVLAAVNELSKRHLQVWPEMLAQMQGNQQEWQSQQVQAWTAVVDRQQLRDQSLEAARDQRLQGFLASVESRQADHQSKLRLTVEQIDAVQSNVHRVVEHLGGIMTGEQELLQLQHSLADNLRLLQQTQRFDEAVNGLTAAIHLLTARNAPAVSGRAA